MKNIEVNYQKRNVFNLSHARNLTMDMGELVPTMLEEVYPGDTFKVQTEMLLRLSPLLAPVMHEFNVYTHYWFVPFRLIWDNFQKFMTGGDDGEFTTTTPYMTSPASTGYLVGSLADYFGLPTDVAGYQHSALPFRAYDLIWNNFYRDQNLQDEVTIVKTDGSDTTTDIDLLYRCWEKDYFTASLPFAQKGDPVYLPLGTSAPVSGSTSSTAITRKSSADQWLVYDAGTNNASTTGANIYTVSNNFLGINDAGPNAVSLDPNGGLSLNPSSLNLTADLSTASAATINELREAFQIQKWMERSARGGSRYIEAIYSHFGVKSSDARLQLPEYLGGGKSLVLISEVLQTGEAGTTPQGNMAGHAISAQKTWAFTKSFEEHGYIIALTSVMPKTQYQQGLPRIWSRQTKFDYFWPELQNLGEQAVKNKEVYIEAAQPEDIWGYVPRYEELRRRENTVHGQFRDVLDYWHAGRIFDTEPALNEDFVKCVPTKRFSAVEDEDNVYIQLVNKVKAVRLLSKMGTPGLIDHN